MRGSAERDQIVVDGVVFDLVDPALCTPTPEVDDARRDPDVAAAAAAVVPPSAAVLEAVPVLRADRLSDAGLIDAAVACERLKAAVDAKQAEFLAQLAKRDPQDAEFLSWHVHRTTDGAYDWTSPTRHHYRYRPPEHPVPTTPQPPATNTDPPPF